MRQGNLVLDKHRIVIFHSLAIELYYGDNISLLIPLAHIIESLIGIICKFKSVISPTQL